MPVKSRKVQLEARHSSKQSDFKRDFEGKTSMIESALEGKRSMLEQCFRALSGFKARSSTDFERSVAFRRSKKQARAVIWSAQRPKSKLEQLFRAPSGYGARLSSDPERTLRKKRACAMFSNAFESAAEQSR